MLGGDPAGSGVVRSFHQDVEGRSGIPVAKPTR